MIIKLYGTVCALMLFALTSNTLAQTTPNAIIPKPVSVSNPKGQAFTIDKKTLICADAIFNEQATYLQELLQQQCNIPIVVAPRPNSTNLLNYIALVTDSANINKPEMYQLYTDRNMLYIKANDVAGMVHGIQTLMQLLPLEAKERIKIEPIKVVDYPRFTYRGMHLDVSRHIFPLAFIKKYIDYLAFHKFNTFHWHLTDDQGWRLEIKAYPKLTEVGAWRNSTLIGHFKDTPARYDSTRYGGFYTQEEVKTIIKYAAIRGISIVPEIDIPGHSRAVIAAYPEFSTKPDTNWQVANTWGMYNRQNNVLAPNEQTFRFLETVFDEVAALFPGEYIHIGGDECSKLWWKASASSQQFIKSHNLKNEAGLQTYFIQQVADHLKAKGKKVIGWDEITEGELDPSTIIMSWRGEKGGIDAALKKHPVVMTPGTPLYFDNYQTKAKNDSLAIHGYNPMDAVYNYNPVPKELRNAASANLVLGAQANVWTEYMANEAKVEYMIFPRMTALSEVLWTADDKKDFKDFKRRLKKTMIPRYLFWNSNYCKVYEEWTMDKAK